MSISCPNPCRSLEVLAIHAIDEADGGEVLHAGETGACTSRRKSFMNAERVGAADAGEHGVFLTTAASLAGHLHAMALASP